MNPSFECQCWVPDICDFRLKARRRIGKEDWPILLQLERAGKLTFQNDDIRARFQRMKPAIGGDCFINNVQH